jgi:hypothetical protein
MRNATEQRADSPSQPARASWGSRRYGALLFGLLLASLGLRAVFVFHGGQYFWPDEVRYIAARRAWELWGTGQWKAGALQIMAAGDHLAFKAIMLGPAWLQKYWPDEIRIPSMFVSLFSVANIFWVWLIARRAGAEEREAFWAATAMAASTSMAYWARHLMPYDVAMFWALACLYKGLAPRPRPIDSLLTGLLGFLAFVSYLGYWAIVACALLTHVLRAWPDRRAVARRAALAFLGSAGSFLLLLEIGHLMGSNLLLSLRTFAGQVTQGDFNQGHRVFFDYLWSTEGPSALIWGASLLASFWLGRGAEKGARLRGGMWAASIIAIGAILIVGANVLHVFVVYGRLARQVVPFCALLVGWTAARLFRDRPWGWGERLALLALLAVGASRMVSPLRQDFPAPFRERAQAAMADYRRTHAEVEAVAPSRFRILYDYFIWPYPSEAPVSPRSEVLRESRHPMMWRPYLFEGFNDDQRKRVEATDVSMKLVLVRD